MFSEKPGRPEQPNVEVSKTYQVDVGKAEARERGEKLGGVFDGTVGQEIRELLQRKAAADKHEANMLRQVPLRADESREEYSARVEAARAKLREQSAELEAVVNALGRMDSKLPVSAEDREMVRAYYEFELEQSAQNLQEAFDEKGEKMAELLETDPDAVTRYTDREATIATLKNEFSALPKKGDAEAQQMEIAISAMERAQEYSPVGQIEKPYQIAQRRMKQKSQVLEKINKLP